jgi:hypothetical protein
MEKPNFYEHEELILAVHLLLALWDCDGRITERKISVRKLHESALEKFMEFKKIFGGALVGSSLEKYYSTEYEEPIHVGEAIMYKVKKKREHLAYQLPTYLILIG